jgi:CRISPR-associated exonuclease Cas4
LKGELIYDDLGGSEKPLMSREFMITGKPDRIMKVKNGYIPIEYKDSIHNKPLEGHVLQLGAYFIIIEENFGRAPYGLLEYRNISFKIKNTETLRLKVLETANSVRKNNNPFRNHNNPAKCGRCPFREVCYLKLA